MRLPQRIAHERLTQMCFIDYAREMALVVSRTIPESGNQEILAVGRMNKLHGTNEAEFAILVSDNWHHRGLGIELLRRLVEIGRDEKLSRIYGDILPENRNMLRIIDRLGFRRLNMEEDGIIRAEIEL
jgi:acetyltransferase